MLNSIFGSRQVTTTHPRIDRQSNAPYEQRKILTWKYGIRERKRQCGVRFEHENEARMLRLTKGYSFFSSELQLGRVTAAEDSSTNLIATSTKHPWG